MNHKQEQRIEEDVLFGKWPSAYRNRVALALILKGIPYKYVEEDLADKSELLESLVILEYVNEIWDHSPKLLPQDPYQRAKVSFCITLVNFVLSSFSRY
ncbi:hypothetical protein L6164_020791 [Bauhinia variegata]|uniref:Uncharacterized protein n=1 Tax=Bauhinia variegata TaxID=167791 RepID=A0ACB9MXN9_BAUVA|nr:hypothetical protein L6164_020791 [Bauhinia variegata]